MANKKKKSADRSIKKTPQKKSKYEKTGFKNRKPSFYILFISLIGMILLSTYFMFNPPNPGLAVFKLENRGQSYVPAGITQVTLIDGEEEMVLSTTSQIKDATAALNTIMVDDITEVSEQVAEKQIVIRSLINAKESNETMDKYFNFNTDMTTVWVEDESQTTSCHTIYDNEELVKFFANYMYPEAE